MEGGSSSNTVRVVLVYGGGVVLKKRKMFNCVGGFVDSGLGGNRLYCCSSSFGSPSMGQFSGVLF